MAYQFTDADRNLLKQAQANKSSLDQRQQRQLEALQKIDLIQQANRQTKAPYAQPNRQEQAAARQELGRQMKTATETMEKSRAKNLSFRQAATQKSNPETMGRLEEQYAPTTMKKGDYERRIQTSAVQLKSLKSALQEVQGAADQMNMGGETEADSKRYKALVDQYGTPQELKAKIQELEGQTWADQQAMKYGDLRGNEDYQENAKPAGDKRTAGLGIGFGTKWVGAGDPAYDYINNLEGIREVSGPRTGPNEYAAYDYMTPEEIADYNYLYNTQGKKAARDYLDYLEYSLNARQMNERRQSDAEFTTEHPHIASALSTPMKLLGGLGTLDIAAQNAANAITGDHKPIDYNSYGMIPTAASSTIRGTRAQNLADKYGTIQLDEEDHPFLSSVFNGKSLGDVYQLGMSMADSGTIALLAMAGIPAGVGTALLGGSAASQGILDAVDAGATDSQALAMGILNGTFEALAEKVPLEKLIGGNSGNIVRDILDQSLTEGSEELITTLANTVADVLVMAEKSDYATKVTEYESHGMSRDKATLKALEDIAIGMGWDFAGGALSGGLMRAGSYALGEVAGRQKARTEGEKTEVSPVTGEQVQTQADAQAATDTQTDTDTQADVQAEAQQAREDQGQQDRAMEAQAENARQEAAQARQEAQQQSQDVLTEIAQGMARDLPQQEQQAPSDPGMEAVNRAAAETYGVQQEQPAGDAQMQENLQEQQGAEPGQNFSRIVPDDGKGAGKKYSGKAKSQYYENTGVKSTRENINQATQFVNENNEEATYHDVHNQRHIENRAKKQTSTPEGVARSYERLIQKSKFDDQDVATAKAIIDKMWASGDAEASAAMTSKLASQIGDAARVMRTAQNNTIYDARSPKAAVESFIKQIDQMKPEDTTFKPGSQGAEKAKTAVTEIGFEIENAKTADDVREIIRQLAVKRKTTAWFGLTNRLSADAQYMINKMGVDDLKVVANWQIASMADDFRKRSKTEILMGIRKNNMLMSMKTFLRNLGGNSASGVLDAFSSSTSGRMADAVLSKFTGVRTVGNEIKQSGKYLKGALDGTKFAAMCVELNIPIETDIRGLSEGLGKDNKFVGKTWTSNGNFMQRFLYANQKWMSYALEVSDKLFEGGTNSQVAASLESMNSNLTEEQASDIAEFESNRRTFKDGTWDDDDGHHGAVLSQAAQGLKNGDFIKSDKARKAYKAGADIVMPFASVPMNVAQTGIDYTVGIAKGAYEIAGIIKDAKAGMEINPVRQRQAASDFGRGMTGVGMVALFAVAKNFGVLRVSDDDNRDKKALEQSEGLSGAQINWSALGRVFEGESGEWQDGDVISTVDFLEPFNTQIYLGAQLAEDESVRSLSGVAGATAKSVMASLLDSPMMTGISEIVEIVQNVNDAEDPADIGQELARYVGDVAGSFIPQFVRQGAQLADGYYRDTRGSTQAETAKNSIISAIPGASQDLPRKYDGLGQVQEWPGFLGTFVDPTYTKEYHPNEVTRFLEEISGQTGDMGIYPGRQAPMSLTIDGETVSLDGTQRETYQKTYGEKVNEYYRGLMDNDAFRKLTPELQAEALKKAKGYAGDFAKASVSGYTDTPKGTSGEITGKIVTDTILGSMNGIFSGFDEDISKGKSTGDLAKAMEDTYRQLMNIPESQREKAVEIQGGTVANYYDARKNGVSSEDFAAALGAIGSAEKTGSVDKKTGEARRTNSDIYGAIAGAGLDDKTADAIMRAYMPDYDPENGSTEKTEVKYDFIRALGLSPEEYAQVYRANGTSSKKAGKIEAFRELGYDARMADLLYKIFAGNQDVADKMLEWYESR